MSARNDNLSLSRSNAESNEKADSSDFPGFSVDGIVCPSCGSKNVTFDDMGFWDDNGQYFDSRETGRCYDCGHSDFMAFFGYV